MCVCLLDSGVVACSLNRWEKAAEICAPSRVRMSTSAPSRSGAGGVQDRRVTRDGKKGFLPLL